MAKLLMIMSKDPFTTETPDLALNIGCNAVSKGNDVSFYLVEDGVTAARDHEFGKRLAAVQKELGIKIYADDRAVASRGIGDRLIEGVEVREIGMLLDFIMDSDRVVWF
ncbi:MAG: DsrE family protein [Candidatus Methanoperedens sp.]|nr:DsrE family protein [Candidatus Methanoperedens sp.]MCZ7360422.1 DsrE family protein [Candidatus Methanoperedens sp.]HLB71948.1 DsrE family protein [Candidatus Methanoperedens sp.]